MVGATGLEPVTPAVSRQCFTSELRTQKGNHYNKKINLNNILTSKILLVYF